MKPFEYVRPRDHCGSGRRRFGAGRRLSRWRHQSSRSDEGQCQPPEPARRHHASSRPRRIGDLPGGGVRIGALIRNAELAHDARFRAALSGRRRGATIGSIGATSQRCHRRRQSPAAYALRLLLRCRKRLQQARTWRGLRCPRRRQPAACRHGLERKLHRDASVRFLRAVGRARRYRRTRRQSRPARNSARSFSPFARQHARPRNCA